MSPPAWRMPDFHDFFVSLQGDGEKKIEQQQGGAIKPEVKLEGAALTDAIKKQVETSSDRKFVPGRFT